jgi:hypothetical protein
MMPKLLHSGRRIDGKVNAMARMAMAGDRQAARRSGRSAIPAAPSAASHTLQNLHDALGNRGMQRSAAPRPLAISARTSPGTIQRACASSERCDGNGQADELPWIQRKSEGGGAPSRSIASAALGGQGSGHSLDSASRAFMEPRFGRDFGAVRVHADAAASRAAKMLSAEAFTVGGDIYFAEGRYRPNTPSGRRLLAHELTHTVQQDDGTRPTDRRFLTVSHPDDGPEREAERVSRQIADGSSPDAMISSQSAVIQRQPTQDAPPPPATPGDSSAGAPGSVTINFLSIAPWYARAVEDASPAAISVELYGLEAPSLVVREPLTGAFAIQPNLLRPAYRALFDSLTEQHFKADVDRVESILFDSVGLLHWSDLVQVVRDWSRLHDVSRNGGENWFDSFLARLSTDYSYYDYGITTGAKTSFLDQLFAAGGDDVGALFALVSQNSERFGLYRPPDALLRAAGEPPAPVNPALVKRAADLVLERLEGITTSGESGAITSILTGLPAAGQAAVLQEIMGRYDETDWTGLFGRYGERRPVGMLWWLFEDLTSENRRTLADSLVVHGVLQKDGADALVAGRGYLAQVLPYTTDLAVESTQYWADQYERSSGASAALYGLMGGLSVLATPRVIDQTALVLGTAGVGAEFGPVLAARAPTIATGLTVAGVGFAGYQAGVAVGRLIDGRDANGRPLDSAGRASLGLLAISNILFAAAGILSLGAPVVAPETGISRTEPQVTPGAGAAARPINVRLVSFDPESGEMLVAAQDPVSGEYALGRMNVKTGAGQLIGPRGQVAQVENFQLAPTRPALPAPGETQPGLSSPATDALQLPGGAALSPGRATPPALPGGPAPPPALPPGLAPPLALPAGASPPLALPGARFNTLLEILPDPARRFVVTDIERGYQAYVASVRPPRTPAARDEWVRLTRGGPRAELLRWLGPNFPVGEGEPVFLRLADIPRPPTLTDVRLADALAQLEAQPQGLRARYDPTAAAGPMPGEINLGNFNILKGNVGEILALPIRSAIVSNVATKFPGAQVYDGVRMRLPQEGGVPGAALLFGDGVVAETIGRNLIVRGVVEIKTGSAGGQTATVQHFEWSEGRIAVASQLVLADGRTFTYDPDGVIRLPDGTRPPRVIFLLAAERFLIAPPGAENLGAGSSMGIGPRLQRYAHPFTTDEINYVTRLAAERLGAPTPQPAPSPSP